MPDCLAGSGRGALQSRSSQYLSHHPCRFHFGFGLVGGLKLAGGHPYGVDFIRRACAKGNDALGSKVFDPARTRDLVCDLATDFHADFPVLLSSTLDLPVVLSDYGEDTEAFRVERYLSMAELARGESNWSDYPQMLRTLLIEFESLLSSHRVL